MRPPALTVFRSSRLTFYRPSRDQVSRSPTKLSNELAKVLQPSQLLPASAPRNPRWSLETRLDAAAIESDLSSRSRRRDSADERQRFSGTNSLATSRATSYESLRPGPIQACPDPFPQSEQVISFEDPALTNFSKKITPSIYSKYSDTTNMKTPTVSIFSRRDSDATSFTIPSIAPSIAPSRKSIAPSVSSSTIPYIDENGICQNPQCNQRTFLQRKAFSLYTKLAHSNISNDAFMSESSSSVVERKGKGRAKVRPTCEHVLLYLQAKQEELVSDNLSYMEI
jgi:hypothetical protein